MNEPDPPTRTSQAIDPSAPSAAERFVPGAVLAGRYRITSLIGRGGMGEVYRATDLFLGQPVALKFVAQTAARDPLARERFINEVRTAREITHSNICRVHDIGEVDGQLYISMEYIDGEDLASLLTRIGRLPPDKAMEVAAGVCAGLAAAHARGVLHRDLKPANIMLDGRGNTRIMDFGLAAAGRVSAGEARHGTPAYMAPEQLAGEDVSVKSDIYAMGLVLFEIFTGKRPFQANSASDLLEQRRRGLMARPSSITRDLDPGVERAIVACVDPDPGRRPASALSVAAALPFHNPLEAAIAAGRTPSPETVAEGFGEVGMRPRTAFGILAAILVGLAIAAVWNTQLSWLSRIRLEQPPEELAGTARKLAVQIGQEARPRDTAYGFAYDQDYLAYIDKRRAGRSHVENRLIRFWYRESGSYLEVDRVSTGMAPPSPVTRENPPTTAGMASIDLDPQGRLLRLEVAPALASSRQRQPGDVDWSPLFGAAGLDKSRFQAIDPVWPCPVASDSEAAWTGGNAGDGKLRVQAAALRGRPVYFEVVAPWMSGSSRAAPEPTQGQTVTLAVLLSLFVAAVCGALMLVRLNLRLGRGDRRNAFRAAACVFILSFLVWAIGVRHPPALHQISIGVYAFGWSLAMALLVWTCYLALEPYVRRRWPGALVSFTRVLMGRVKDTLVARDVLFGCAYAVAWALISHLQAAASLASGAARAFNPQLSTLSFQRLAALSFFDLQVAVWSAFILFTLLLLVRAIVKRQGIAIAVLVAVMTLAAAFANPPWAVPLVALQTSLLLWVLVRFGVLTWVVGAAAGPALASMAVPSDLADWYAGPALVFHAVFVGIAIYACLLASRPVGRGLESMIEE